MTDSPRYFYTDALAALWMIKHFGMRLREPTAVPGQYIDVPTWNPWNIPILSGNYDLEVADIGPDTGHEENRYYVHPDSIYLLHPQPGDLICWHNPTAWDSHIHRFTLLDSNAAVHRDNKMLKIIQRAGRAFHWPEQEAA